MQATYVKPTEFNPVTISIKLESQTELNAFAVLFNNVRICHALDEAFNIKVFSKTRVVEETAVAAGANLSNYAAFNKALEAILRDT